MAPIAESIEPAKQAAPPAPLRIVRTQDLIQRMDQLSEKIAKRAFEIFENNGRILGRDLEDWFKAESELLRPVKVSVAESEFEITMRAEVPGFTEKELDIALEPRRFTITGKRESKKETKEERTTFTETTSEQILRIVDLPAGVDTDKATASLKDGILELRAPKVSPPRKLQIQPKSA